jgi:hypothetical protein
MTQLDVKQGYAVQYLRDRVDRARRQLDRTISDDDNRSRAEKLLLSEPQVLGREYAREYRHLVQLHLDNTLFLLVAADHVRKACDFARNQGLEPPRMVTSTTVKALRDLAEHWDLWRETSDGQVEPWLKISAGKKWKKLGGHPFPLIASVVDVDGELSNIGGLPVQDFRGDLDALDAFLTSQETSGDG